MGSTNYPGYSVEFSPDGKYLYTSNYVSLNEEANAAGNVYVRQWNLSALTNTLNYQTQSTIYQTPLSEVQYWTQTINVTKGGGLRLGPDGKIYVFQSFSNKVGAISNPNSSTSLSSRYNANALTLSVTTGKSLEFCTGLTQPGVPISE
jgi:hypothetical protein